VLDSGAAFSLRLADPRLDHRPASPTWQAGRLDVNDQQAEADEKVQAEKRQEYLSFLLNWSQQADLANNSAETSRQRRARLASDDNAGATCSQVRGRDQVSAHGEAANLSAAGCHCAADHWLDACAEDHAGFNLRKFSFQLMEDTEEKLLPRFQVPQDACFLGRRRQNSVDL
jgi:hypothetical protein